MTSWALAVPAIALALSLAKRAQAEPSASSEAPSEPPAARNPPAASASEPEPGASAEAPGETPSATDDVSQQAPTDPPAGNSGHQGSETQPNSPGAAPTEPPAVPPPQPPARPPPAPPAPTVPPGPPGPPPVGPPRYPPPPAAHAPPYSPPARVTQRPPPAAPIDDSIERHDGFYLRLGGGASYLTSRFESPDPGTMRDSASGAGAAFEIHLGGTVAPGLVLGGALIAESAQQLISNELTIVGQPPLRRGFVSHDLAATMIGPLVDWYLDDELGFHLQAAVGMAAISFQKSAFVEDHDTEGWGAMIGFGYELWVGDQWSLGVIARATRYETDGVDSEDTKWKHVAFALPGLIVGATLH